MKQVDRIAKLEKEIEYLKDYVSNLHRTFAALVSEGKLQKEYVAEKKTDEEVKGAPATEKKQDEVKDDAPRVHANKSSIHRRGVM